MSFINMKTDGMYKVKHKNAPDNNIVQSHIKSHYKQTR